jgi:NCS1 family nucleobase:cation symporter-1
MLTDTSSRISLIKRGNIFIPDLYNGESSSRYWFVRGWNPRAVVVTILALVPCLPSFAATIAPNHLDLPLGAQRMFYLSFTVTYALAAIIYYVSYLVWPEKPAAKKELDMRFEQQADEDDEEERRAIRLRAAEDGDPVDEEDIVEGKEYEVDGAKTAVIPSL